MARPTDYNEQIPDRAREYIAFCKDTNRDVNLPTAEGLALYLGVVRRTIYYWAEEHEEFLHILDELNSEQAKRLINNGLSGKYNSNIAKLVLAKHGYKDQLGLSGEEQGEGIKIDVNINEAIDKIYGKPKSD